MLISLIVLTVLTVYVAYLAGIIYTCDWWLDSFGLHSLASIMWIPVAFFFAVLPIFIVLGVVNNHAGH